MRDTIDSFLRFLGDNLVGVTLHAIREDKDKPELALFKENALNVQFLSMGFDTRPSTLQVSLDLIFDKELDAVDAAEKVMTLMNTAASTPKQNYSNPASPVAIDGWIYWNTAVKFRKVFSDYSAHFTATIVLNHYQS